MFNYLATIFSFWWIINFDFIYLIKLSIFSII